MDKKIQIWVNKSRPEWAEWNKRAVSFLRKTGHTVEVQPNRPDPQFPTTDWGPHWVAHGYSSREAYEVESFLRSSSALVSMQQLGF